MLPNDLVPTAYLYMVKLQVRRQWLRYIQTIVVAMPVRLNSSTIPYAPTSIPMHNFHPGRLTIRERTIKPIIETTSFKMMKFVKLYANGLSS